MKKSERLRKDLQQAKVLIREARNGCPEDEYVRARLEQTLGLIARVREELIYGIQCESCAR
jgi:hypothetical protein